MRFYSTLIATLLGSTAVVADPIALVIGNEDYTKMPDVRRADDVTREVSGLEQAGVKVVPRRNAEAERVFSAVSQYGDAVASADKQIVVLTGRFVQAAGETYFLPSDQAATPFASLHRRALPLSVVLTWLGTTPGDSILVLAGDDDDTGYGPFMANGIGTLDLPQGVTLLQGPVANAQDMVERLAEPGALVLDAARREKFEVSGFAPRDLTFLDEPEEEPEVRTSDANDDNRLKDLTDWRAADDKNSVEAYEAYIAAHPRGAFVAQARARIEALNDTPEKRAEAGEKALNLTRDQRREIQRMLTLLDYNTRGIDGIFGRGTRAAIAKWQGAESYEVTGFLTREQIVRLDAQAERRSAELEAEAERQRAEQLARDQAFWEETGSYGDEAGLRAYLKRYPDGEYAEVAQERLDEIERQKRRDASERDRGLWDQATVINSAEAYREYLRLSPDGAFRDDAVARLEELEAAEEAAPELSRAAQAEQNLNLSQKTVRIIEGRLDSLGLRPGNVDGVLDEDSRRAIRRYQAARNLEETGYLSEEMVVRLLADTVRSIFK